MKIKAEQNKIFSAVRRYRYGPKNLILRFRQNQRANESGDMRLATFLN